MLNLDVSPAKSSHAYSKAFRVLFSEQHCESAGVSKDFPAAF